MGVLDGGDRRREGAVLGVNLRHSIAKKLRMKMAGMLANYFRFRMRDVMPDATTRWVEI